MPQKGKEQDTPLLLHLRLSGSRLGCKRISRPAVLCRCAAWAAMAVPKQLMAWGAEREALPGRAQAKPHLAVHDVDAQWTQVPKHAWHSLVPLEAPLEGHRVFWQQILDEMGCQGSVSPISWSFSPMKSS